MVFLCSWWVGGRKVVYVGEVCRERKGGGTEGGTEGGKEGGREGEGALRTEGGRGAGGSRRPGLFGEGKGKGKGKGEGSRKGRGPGEGGGPRKVRGTQAGIVAAGQGGKTNSRTAGHKQPTKQLVGRGRNLSFLFVCLFVFFSCFFVFFLFFWGFVFVFVFLTILFSF